MNLIIFGLCILVAIFLSNCDKLDGEIDLNEEKGFNTSKYPKGAFLTPLPSTNIRTISYHIRQPNPFSLNVRPITRPDMAYSKVYLHLRNNNSTKGLVQFRQLSDMWFTEIKGVVESLEPNSSYLMVVHQNPSSIKNNSLCESLGQPFHFAPVMSDLRDLRARNSLGDLGIVTASKDGVGFINLNSIYTSLFDGPGTITSRSVALYKLKKEEVLLTPILCGDIKMPTYSPANFLDDQSPLIRKLNSTFKPTSSTTETPDFDKPPLD